MANDGRIQKGQHLSKATEFKKGQHWRPRKPHWDKEWLENEYIAKQLSANDIAKSVGVTEAAIYHWLKKHAIERRTVAQARSIKHWGLSGDQNGMFGKRGAEVPGWKGGITPERQAFYSLLEWKEAEKFVRSRDGNICQRCKMVNKSKRQLHIHHIATFQQAPELRADVENLISLCSKCHKWVHSKANIDNQLIIR